MRKLIIIIITLIITFTKCYASNFGDFDKVSIVGIPGVNNIYVIGTNDNGKLIKPVYGSLSETYLMPNTATTPIGYAVNIYLNGNASGINDTIIFNTNGFISIAQMPIQYGSRMYVKLTNGGFNWFMSSWNYTIGGDIPSIPQKMVKH